MKYLKTITSLGLFTLASFLAGCQADDRASTFDAKGPLAREQLHVFWATVEVSLLLFVLVGGALAYVLWRYREKEGDEDKPLPEEGHGNPLIEVGLIGFSVACLVYIAVPTLKAIWSMNELEAGFEYTEDRDVLEINVRGYQWWWGFEYVDYTSPHGEKVVTTGNEFVIPKNKVVKLNLRSDNVIHSFWLPKIAGKVDVMPGRDNWMWILAEEEGHYYGACAEYCGEAHAYMYFRCDVVSNEEFDAWMDELRSGAPSPLKAAGMPGDWNAFYKLAQEKPEVVEQNAILNGAKLFYGEAGCTQCHRIDGSQRAESGMLGPNLTNIGSRKTVGAAVLENRRGIDDNWRDILHGGFDGLNEDEEFSTSTATIDPEIQHGNLVKWIKESHDIKPGNLMYRSVKREWTDADKQLLQKQGKLNWGEQLQLMESGMMQNEVSDLTETPFTLDDIERGQTVRLTDKDFEDMATYLQTLRVELD